MRTVIADRFEVTDANRWRTFGLDRLTGARVLVVETWPAGWPVSTALDVAALRAMATQVIAMDHPRVARVLSVDPVVVEAGPEHDAQPALTEDEWIRIADELAETMEALFERGVVPVDPGHAWVERGQDGRAEVRVPAPSGPPGLHYKEWRPQARYQLARIASWVESRAASAALGDAIERRMERRPSAADDRPLMPTLDFDLAIRLGEAELARTTELAVREKRQGLRDHATMPLAAAYHHRGCVAWSRGDREHAERDVSRAIELEAHARYLTTAALWAEARGDLGAAAEHHARGVCATQPKAPVGRYDETAIIPLEFDRPERADRDATRTLTARAAFLARAGRYEEARADLEASIARKPTVGALAWLSSVRRKLGDREGAIEAADRALALDPTSAAAARMRSLA